MIRPGDDLTKLLDSLKRVTPEDYKIIVHDYFMFKNVNGNNCSFVTWYQCPSMP